MTSTKINAQITISASYNDSIVMTITDKDANTTFLRMVFTREQFINATMNRLCQTEVGSAYVENLDRVGKQQRHYPLVFEIPESMNKESACKIAQEKCPEGWIPDLYFQSQNSFFDKFGKHYAQTIIRKWELIEQKEKQTALNLEEKDV